MNNLWEQLASVGRSIYTGITYIDQTSLNGQMDSIKNVNTETILSNYMELIFLTTSPTWPQSPAGMRPPNVQIAAFLFHIKRIREAMDDPSNLPYHRTVLSKYLFMITIWEQKEYQLLTGTGTVVDDWGEPKACPYKPPTPFDKSNYSVVSIMTAFPAERLSMFNWYVQLIFEVEKYLSYTRFATDTGAQKIANFDDLVNYNVICRNILALHQCIMQLLAKYPLAEQALVKNYFSMEPMENNPYCIAKIVAALKGVFERNKNT